MFGIHLKLVAAGCVRPEGHAGRGGDWGARVPARGYALRLRLGPSPMNPMTVLLESIEHQTGSQPTWSVLWLHGLGADGNDFAPIVPDLVRREWPAIRFVFPHAPVRTVTINGGARMRAWYDIRDVDLANRADHEGLAESVAQVDTLIARESERGIAADRICGGFFAGRRGHPRRRHCGEQPGGIDRVSTYLPMVPAQAQACCNRRRRRNRCSCPWPVRPLWCPRGWRQGCAALRALGFDVQWQRYRCSTRVCADEIRDLGDWMTARFAA